MVEFPGNYDHLIEALLPFVLYYPTRFVKRFFCHKPSLLDFLQVFQLDLELQDLVVADLLFPCCDSSCLEVRHHHVYDSFSIPTCGKDVLFELLHMSSI